mgnify:CR=1 FL=1
MKLLAAIVALFTFAGTGTAVVIAGAEAGPDAVELAEAFAAEFGALGVRVEMLSGESLKARLPGLRDEWVLGALEHDAQVTVRITGRAEARALNRNYRGRDYATKVKKVVLSMTKPGAYLCVVRSGVVDVRYTGGARMLLLIECGTGRNWITISVTRLGNRLPVLR